MCYLYFSIPSTAILEQFAFCNTFNALNWEDYLLQLTKTTQSPEYSVDNVKKLFKSMKKRCGEEAAL